MRQLLSQINDLGAIGTRFLDLATIVAARRLGDWARTMNTSAPRIIVWAMSVGFKNGDNGSIQIAIDGIGSANNPHHFLSVINLATQQLLRLRA